MQAIEDQLSLNLIMGSKENTDMIAKARFTFAIGQQQVAKLKNQLNFPHPLENQLILSFVFGCQLGRESQCIQYIQSGIQNNQIENIQNLSPLQALFRNPKSKGQIAFTFAPGQITVLYRFTQEHIEDIEYDFTFLSPISTYVTMTGQLRGHVAHNNQNRTAVKIDYSQFHITSQKLIPQQIIQVVRNIQQDKSGYSEDQNQLLNVFNNPMVLLLGKVKKIKVNLHTNSFRKIFNYFQKAKKNDGIVEHQTKDFPYVAPGLLKGKANFSMFFKKKYAMNLTVDYHSQQVFLRLIKVYCTFLDKGLGMSF